MHSKTEGAQAMKVRAAILTEETEGNDETKDWKTI